MQLHFWIIIIASISSILHKFLVKANLLKHDKPVIGESSTTLILIVMNYTYSWASIIHNILSCCDEPENVNFGIIFLCDKSSEIAYVPKDLQHNVKIVHRKKRKYLEKSECFKESFEKLYENEDYIAILNASSLYPSWDTLCKQVYKKNTVLTSPPSIKGKPTFPVLKKTNDGHRVCTPRQFANTCVETVPATIICNTFIFIESKLFKKLNFCDNQIEFTNSTKYYISCPCFLCVNSGVLKKDSGIFENVHDGIYSGLSQQIGDSECILKYGSVESAKLNYEFK